jgi:hypothetical protein
MRRWLVIPSIAVHVGIIVALLFLGAWHLDRLEAGRHEVRIGYVPPPPPASEGSPAPKKATPFQHKHITHDLVTPPETPAKPDVTPEVADPNDGLPGNGLGSGSGSGSGEGPPGTTDGPCLADCGPPVVETKKIVEKKLIAPTVFSALRIAGETNIQASSDVRNEMMRDGKQQVTAMFKVCLDGDGNVTQKTQLKSAGYGGYDEALQRGVSTWRYRPYTVDGRGIPVCGIVTFVYTMR